MTAGLPQMRVFRAVLGLSSRYLQVLVSSWRCVDIVPGKNI